MGGFLEYLRLVLSTAFRRSTDWAQFVLYVVFLTVGAFVWAARNDVQAELGKRLMAAVLSWQGAAIILGLVVLTRLVLAPYWIYKDQQKQIEERQQKLELFASVSQFGVGEDAGKVAVQAIFVTTQLTIRTQAAEEKVREAEQAKVELETQLTTARAVAAKLDANGAAMSSSITELIDLLEKMNHFREVHLASAQRIEALWREAEERFRAAMHTVYRIADALFDWKDHPEVKTGARLATVWLWTRQFSEAVNLYMAAPETPGGRPEGMERFRAIPTSKTPKPLEPSASDSATLDQLRDDS